MTGTVHVRRPPRGGRRLRLALISLLGTSGACALAAPGGGQIVAGSGSIATSGPHTAVQQNTDRLVIDWNRFSTRANESVAFSQPGARSIALNRVVGQDPSVLLGKLDANGQVFIVNPNGVLFGAGSRVNVGGLIASTLSLSSSDFLAGRYAFASGGAAGAVVNKGVIRAAPGGYVALIGRRAVNEGTIAAPGGQAALAAGNRVTVTLGEHSMIGLSVDQGVLDALAANRGLIEADGGQALLAAGAEGALLAGVVNNTGVILARTAVNQNGVIRLVAEGGTVQVGGVLDASAPNGGNGGTIQTVGSRVAVSPHACLTTAAASGDTGTWLVAARSLTVASHGGDVSGATISRALGTTNVALGAFGRRSGTVSIDDAIGWSSPNTLAVLARNDIAVNAPLVAPAGVVLFGTGASLTQRAGIAAAGVALVGGRGRYRLDDPSNRIATIAANTGSVTLVDGVPLTVGTVGPVSGIATSGPATLRAPSLTLDAPVQSTATGTAVTLASVSGFANRAGAGAISTRNGRWLVYSSDPNADAFGGLQSGNLALWGESFPAASANLAAAGGNRFVFGVQQQAVLSVKPGSAKEAGTARALGPEDVLLSLRYTGADYGNAFADGPTTHEPLAFTVTSAGAGAGAAAGEYIVTVTPTSLPAGYRVSTLVGTLRVNATTTPTEQPTAAPKPPQPPVTPLTPIPPEPAAEPPATSPVLTALAPAPLVIDAVQTVAGETRDDPDHTAVAMPPGLTRPATPVVQTTSDPASDGSRLPDDAWPGNVCRM
ncbi:filamentous hemagglutinin N-terminal domain-containing protein [Caballeronia telluris]|uniref:Filamentous hemagglutinin outer membrane protein n=1 Tax=Caballeronia telluris TaxID=326475 RepID=A0A158GZ98_9BURK|nr:filamentous hemagglutinin N-terminal domain-containing protein [Caballeronia telluris]SAL37494.1 filamentous hemagglutinin outer membrane protein [Caballeronia telluris]